MDEGQDQTHEIDMNQLEFNSAEWFWFSNSCNPELKSKTRAIFEKRTHNSIPDFMNKPRLRAFYKKKANIHFLWNAWFYAGRWLTNCLLPAAVPTRLFSVEWLAGVVIVVAIRRIFENDAWLDDDEDATTKINDDNMDVYNIMLFFYET